MTPGSDEHSVVYALAPSRLAGMWRGPVELLVTDDGDVEDVVDVVATVADGGTVAAATGLVIPLDGVAADWLVGGGGGGGGLSSYKLPFIMAHQVTPEVFPVPAAGDAACTLSYRVAAVHATWSVMV